MVGAAHGERSVVYGAAAVSTALPLAGKQRRP